MLKDFMMHINIKFPQDLKVSITQEKGQSIVTNSLTSQTHDVHKKIEQMGY